MATIAATTPIPPVAFSAKDATKPGHYSASETAFLLLDFHSMFIQAGGEAGTAALKTAIEMRAWAKSQKIQVIHCLIDVKDTPFPTTKDFEKFASIMVAMRSSAGDEAAELHDGDTSDEVTFTRRPGHISALYSHGLSEFLKEKGIKSLVLAGLSTSGCMLRTAVAASDAEFVVTALADGCADSDPALHDVIVGKILPNRAYVVTAEEFREGYTAMRAT